MSTLPTDHSASSVSSVSPNKQRFRWQFSLRLMLLLMAAVGVWTAVIVNRRAIPHLEQRIKTMRPLARELFISDPTKIAVVKCEELWYDDNEWEIYLPPGAFQLSLATREIDGQGMATPVKSAPLPTGQTRLVYSQVKQGSGWRMIVTANGQELLTVDEPKEWYPAHGSSGGGQFSLSQQLPADAPVVLFRRRFTRPISPTSSQVPAGPCEGVLLWIEPAPPASPSLKP